MRKEGFYARNGSGRYLSGARATRTAPVFQSRLLRALLVVVTTAAVELVLWQLFVMRSYWREIFLPVAGAVALIGAFVLWRAVRPRSSEDRRDGDRRLADRRTDQP